MYKMNINSNINFEALQILEGRRDREKEKQEVTNDQKQALLRCIDKLRLKYNYVFLDSNNCLDTDRRQGLLKWYLHDSNPDYVTGVINVRLRKIVMVRLSRLLYAHLDPVTAGTVSSRVAIQIIEFGNQSMLLNGRQFQFIQKLPEDSIATVGAIDTTNDPPIYGTSVTTTGFSQNRGWFRLAEPIERLDSISLSLYTLPDLTPIVLPEDYTSFYAEQIIGTVATTDLFIVNPVLPSFNGLPVLYYPNGSNYKPLTPEGYTVEKFRFSGFTTDDPITDAALIAAYNQDYALEYVSSGYFKHPIDVSGGTYNPGTTSIPITITLLYKPRLTGVLEFLTED